MDSKCRTDGFKGWTSSGSFRAMENPSQTAKMENESKGMNRVSQKLLLLGVLAVVIALVALTALGTYVSTNNDNPSEKTDGSGGAQQPPAGTTILAQPR